MDTNSLITEYLEYLEHSCGFAIRTLKLHKRVCKAWDQFLSTKASKQLVGATPDASFKKSGEQSYCF